MTMDKIIDKINKLLALANNNPNESEAMSAALKAQELMARYNIEVEQLDQKPENREIVKEIYAASDKHEMKKWKFGLAAVIAENFRCKMYVINKQDVVFYGFQEDAKIALSVFSFLYQIGNKLAVRYYNRCKKDGTQTRGVMNTYLIGFKNGVAEALSRQCVALMIVTPQEVTDSFEDMAKNMSVMNTKVQTNGNREAYNQGMQDGRDSINSRSLEA